MNQHTRPSYYLVSAAVVLAFIVVVLGAYTRLSDAGLGCPDWPGCYGQLSVPNSMIQVHHAQKLFPTIPVEAGKAWKEMVHRYAAGTLGLLILCVAGFAVYKRRHQHPLFLPLLLVGLVVFQAALGMWTVTLKLLPVVVMGHLLGGLSILALLWLLRHRLGHHFKYSMPLSVRQYRPWAVLAVIIIVMQLALGGWVTSNYAGLACVGFPSCNGSLFPHINLHQAFNFFSPIGANYQGGLLNSTARVTIQMAHRVGALITGVYLSFLGIWILWTGKSVRLKSLSILMLFLLIIQISLGVLNVEWLLPLPIAVAHNAVGALLLLSVVSLAYGVFAHKHEEL